MVHIQGTETSLNNYILAFPFNIHHEKGLKLGAYNHKD